jgi:hypothetical protein
MKRINQQEAYSFDGACTNQAEEYFSRLRRAEIGIHHHIAGAICSAMRRSRHGGRIRQLADSLIYRSQFHVACWHV